MGDLSLMNKYTTILYDVKRELKITINEYIYLDTVYHLQVKKGFAFATNAFYCERLDITPRQLSRMKASLVERGLLEIVPETNDRKVHVSDIYIELMNPLSGETKCPTRIDKMSDEDRQNVLPHYIENKREKEIRYSKEQKYHPQVNVVIDLFKDIAPTTYTRWYKLGTYKANITELLKTRSFEQVKILIDSLSHPEVRDDDFCPQITNPYELLTKFDKTLSYLRKKSNKIKKEMERVF